MKINKNTKVLILGGGGMLGEAVYNVFSRVAQVMCTDINTQESHISYLDIRDHSAVKETVEQYNPELIIHLGALTDLEYCELHPYEAFATNSVATKNVANIAKELNIPMVYISTAGIFDGKQEYYIDSDTPNPISVYGQSKYDGEVYVQHNVQKHFIFRAGWMMGGGPKRDKKFVNKIMKQIESGSKELFVVDDKLGTPTYTYDFAVNMLYVVQQDAFGLYNMICDGSCSRYDVAQELIKIINRPDIKLFKVSSDHFKQEYFATRPASEKLIPKRLKDSNLYIMRPWKQCLREYLQKQWNTSGYMAGSSYSA